jgi:hypothetical protein
MGPTHFSSQSTRVNYWRLEEKENGVIALLTPRRALKLPSQIDFASVGVEVTLLLVLKLA